MALLFVKWYRGFSVSLRENHATTLFLHNVYKSIS